VQLKTKIVHTNIKEILFFIILGNRSN